MNFLNNFADKIVFYGPHVTMMNQVGINYSEVYFCITTYCLELDKIHPTGNVDWNQVWWKSWLDNYHLVYCLCALSVNVSWLIRTLIVVCKKFPSNLFLTCKYFAIPGCIPSCCLSQHSATTLIEWHEIHNWLYTLSMKTTPSL